MNQILALLSVISFMGLIGCADNKLEGEFHTSENRSAQIGNSEQRLNLQDKDLISIEVESKGTLFSSKLVVKTPTETLKIPVPKTAYSAKRSFEANAFQTGLNVSVKGYPLSQFIREWDEQGTNSCDAGGTVDLCNIFMILKAKSAACIGFPLLVGDIKTLFGIANSIMTPIRLSLAMKGILKVIQNPEKKSKLKRFYLNVFKFKFNLWFQARNHG